MGVLNKYLRPVPDSESYRKRAKSDLLMLLGWFIFGCIVLLCATGCSLEKKVARTYRNAEVYNPLTKEDSLHLIRASKKVIKATPPKVLPGKIVIKQVPVEKIVKVLDSNLLQRISDSLINANVNEADAYNNNIDEVLKGCNKAVMKGIQKGYSQALDSLKGLTYNEKQPDTLLPDESTSMELSDCAISLAMYKDSLATYKAQDKIHHSQAKERGWLALALSIALVVCVFLGVKKTIKTGVSI